MHGSSDKCIADLLDTDALLLACTGRVDVIPIPSFNLKRYVSSHSPMVQPLSPPWSLHPEVTEPWWGVASIPGLP